MKKIIRNIITGLLLSLAVLQFTACGYEPVFYGIMHDVAPEEATVNGNITSIARCSIKSEEYLVLSNGGSVSYKPVSSSKHGEWKTNNIKLPFKNHHYNYFPTSTEGEGHIGQQILQLIADENNIYLLTASFKQDNEYGVVLPDTFYLWTEPLSSLFSGSTESWVNLVEGNEALSLQNLTIHKVRLKWDFRSSLQTHQSPKTEKLFFLQQIHRIMKLLIIC